MDVPRRKGAICREKSVLPTVSRQSLTDFRRPRQRADASVEWQRGIQVARLVGHLGGAHSPCRRQTQ